MSLQEVPALRPPAQGLIDPSTGIAPPASWAATSVPARQRWALTAALHRRRTLALRETVSGRVRYED